MKDVTLKDYQEYLLHLYKNDNDNDLFMKVVEEIGEIAVDLNIRNGIKKGEFKKEDFAFEIIDALHFLIAIASINDIDLTAALYKKDHTGAIKYNRDTNLEEFLAKK